MTSACPTEDCTAPEAAGVWLSTAALVVEILFPDDESCVTASTTRSSETG